MDEILIVILGHGICVIALNVVGYLHVNSDGLDFAEAFEDSFGHEEEGLVVWSDEVGGVGSQQVGSGKPLLFQRHC